MKSITVAGINGKSHKLADVKTEVSQAEINSIMKYGKLANGIYHRIRDGVLVLICSANTLVGELEILVKALSQKMIDQKKKRLFDIAVFEFAA